MKRQILILIIISLLVPFNCFLTYGLMWNPYILYFERPEFSTTDFDTRYVYAYSAALTNFILLLGTTVWMLVRYVRKKKLLFIAPIVSGLTFFMLLHIQTYFPDSTHQYLGKDGYIYIVEEWYLHGKSTYKRWKSEKLSNHYKKQEDIVWQLDSMSVK